MNGTCTGTCGSANPTVVSRASVAGARATTVDYKRGRSRAPYSQPPRSSCTRNTTAQHSQCASPPSSPSSPPSASSWPPPLPLRGSFTPSTAGPPRRSPRPSLGVARTGLSEIAPASGTSSETVPRELACKPSPCPVPTYTHAAQLCYDRSCQATDHNGCVPGDTTHINSLEVDVRPHLHPPAPGAIGMADRC